MPLAPPTFDALLDALSHPAAYPFPTTEIEVHQTHISAVFLAGPYAYKLKKPLNLGFLDFTTPERRKAACEDEVRLNRRLAPQVYLGVVPVTAGPEGVRIEGSGPVIDYAVWMQRLPAERTLEARLEAGLLGEDDVRRVARRVARFHREGSCSDEIAREARWEVLDRNNEENFDQIRPCIGRTLSAGVYERLRDRSRSVLADLRPLIERRIAAGLPRDTHGDLHLDHVYTLPRAGAEDDLVMIDCIEFNTRFRYADPASDIAFLLMDLEFHGRPDLANHLAEAYFDAAQDSEGRRLLEFFVPYRAIVRGKVEGLALDEPEVAEADKLRLARQARAHFLLALGWLEPPRRRPLLLLVAGLPGSGKSRLCRGLESSAAMQRLDSDVVRKQLAGIGVNVPASSDWGQGIYTPEWNDRTYAELRHRAERILREGGRVAVEASFREERRRLPFLELARSLAVPCVFLECEAPGEIIRERLARRSGDVSDAGVEVYESARRAWEPAGPAISSIRQVISTRGEAEQALHAALAILTGKGLL